MVARMESRFREIDVLRGLAAGTVLFSHYLPYWNRYLDKNLVLVPNEYGYFAVKLFFVISGFVIFMTLDHCKTVVDFAVSRFSRLYPVYWASILVATSIGAVAFGDPIWLGGIVTNLTMFQQFLGYPHLDNVYWSLSVELAFYLNAAWIFAIGLHRKPQWIVLVWLLLASLWALALHAPGEVTAFDLGGGDLPRDWFALLFSLDYSPYFALGVLFHSVQRRGWSVSIAVLMALAFLVEVLFASWEGAAVFLVVGSLFALAVGGLLHFLVSRVTLWLGAVSYSLYLVHRNLGYRLLPWLHDHGLSAALAIGLTLVAALLLATALTYAVERPASAYIRARYARLLARAEASAS